MNEYVCIYIHNGIYIYIHIIRTYIGLVLNNCDQVFEYGVILAVWNFNSAVHTPEQI